MTSAKSQAVWGLMAVAGLLAVFALFFALVIWRFLPATQLRWGRVADQVTYMECAAGVVWIIASLTGRLVWGRWLAKKLTDRSAGWVVNLDFAILNVFCGLIWCLLYARATYDWWVLRGPAEDALIKHVPMTVGVLVGASVAGTLLLWGFVAKSLPRMRGYLLLGWSVGTLLVIELVGGRMAMLLPSLWTV
jgi:hypothetical protein